MSKANIQPVYDYKNISIFEGLNPLRFIAALFVLMHHSEIVKRKNGIDNFEWLSLFKNGDNAVTFFFVLSGFLITYLLLKEQGRTGSIKIKNFYLKRILRIWPLYFLLVIIGTILLPFAFSLLNLDYEMPYSLGQTWFYFCFFLPFLVTLFYGHHFLEPLWSIGVEEIFYLIWAPLFKICKHKIFHFLIAVILIKLFLNITGYFFVEDKIYTYIFSVFQFEAMAIGGLGAYLLYTKGNLITNLSIFKIPVQFVLFSTMVSYLAFQDNIDNRLWNILFKTPIVSPLVIDLLFLYVIICISVVHNSIVKLRNKILSYLGEISYGIYMYHMLIIFGTIHFLKRYLIQMSAFWSHLMYYSIVISFTILVSFLSKHFFENYFLRLKERLA